MNFIIVSFGSKGDIKPFIHLGKSLLARQHNVTLITNEVYKTETEEAGIDFYQVGTKSEYEKLIQSPELFHPQKAFGFVLKNFILKNMWASFEAIRELKNDNTIVISQSIAPAGRIAHEKLSIPLISLNLQPVTFWSTCNPPVFSGLSFVNKLPFQLKKIVLGFINKTIIDKQFAPELNKFLKELNLPAQKNFFSHWLYSPQLVLALFPDWFAKPAEDWVDNVKLVGFVQETKEEQIPAQVEEFLSQGEPPILFTAGSAMQHANHFFKIANEVIVKENKRAIFICNRNNLKGIPVGGNILVIDYVPFGKLFPQTALIVHHGGIGTIIPAILSAKPQIIVPYAHDQPDNASRIETLKLGVTIQPKRFTANSLSQNLNELIRSETIRKNCEQYSKRIDLEQSLNGLIKIIEEFGNESLNR